MLIQRISRTDPERVFIVVRADQAGIIRGLPVSFNMDGTRNGIDVVKCDALPNYALLAGAAHTDIANGDYGLAQCYGYDDDCYVVKTASNIEVGCEMAINTATTAWEVVSVSAANLDTYYPGVVGASQLTTGSSSLTYRHPLFLRLM